MKSKKLSLVVVAGLLLVSTPTTFASFPVSSFPSPMTYPTSTQKPVQPPVVEEENDSLFENRDDFFNEINRFINLLPISSEGKFFLDTYRRMVRFIMNITDSDWS